ncbi:hypothetical protein YPPY32_1130, partial [Yersinia pestis PY-32]
MMPFTRISNGSPANL